MELRTSFAKFCKVGVFFTFLLLAMFVAFAQEDGSDHDDFFNKTIDSAMAISPFYLPTSYTGYNTIFFAPLNYKEIDTTMNHIGLYDPILRTENICQTLGTFGQAHKPINFTYEKSPGFALISLPYPLYIKEQKDLQYYKLQTSYTQIAYNYGIATENEIQASHAQNIKNKINYVFNLRGYSNEGYFTHQRNSNLSLDAIVHYEIPSQIYGFSLSYIINYFNLQENGGLLHSEDFTNQIVDNLQGYNMKFYNATTKLLTHDLQFQQYVNIKSKKKEKNGYWGTFTHTFDFKQQRINYNDINPDSVYYEYFYANNFSKDTIADTLKYYTISNTLQWSSFSPYKEYKNEKYFFHATVGITHEFANYRTDFYKQHTLIPFAQIHTRLFSVMDIYGQIFYTLGGYQKNDVNAKAKITWALNRKRRHFIGAAIDYYFRSPDYIFTYFSNDFYFWRNSWKKQNVLHFSAFWEREGYKAEFNYFMLHRYVCLDSLFQPTQLEKYCNVVQLHLFAPFYIKGFGANANIYLQYSSSKAIQVPIFAGKLALFYRFPLFKNKAKLQFGLNLEYNTLFYGDGYNPIIHQFYPQQQKKIGNYLYMDTYISMQVQRIHFYFRVAHFLSGVMGYHYFSTPDYPMQNRRFSVGITWRFHD